MGHGKATTRQEGCRGSGQGAGGFRDTHGPVPSVPVSKPFVRLTAAAAAEGTEVALMCTVREGTAPLSFSWQHREPHGRLLAAPMGLGGSGAELLLAPANRSHAGWYACTARNEVNNCTSEPVYLDIVCECPGAWLCFQGALSWERFFTRLGQPQGLRHHRDAGMATWVPPWPPSATLTRCTNGHHPSTSQCLDGKQVPCHQGASVAIIHHHHGTSMAGTVPPRPPFPVVHPWAPRIIACSQPLSCTTSKEASRVRFPPVGGCPD